VADIHMVLDRHHDDLKKLPGVLNTAVSEKWSNGVNTHQPAIIIYVERKIAADRLSPSELIPKEIEGIPTDVIEIAPKTWIPGKTMVSQLKPSEQRRLLGVTPPKVVMASPAAVKETAGLEVNWQKYCSPIQDQAKCGSCVAFGCIGIMEACIRALENDPADPIKLSEDQAFFCSGGRCDWGSDCPTILEFLRLHGVCPASMMPYTDSNHACNLKITPGWEQYVRKISSWHNISNLVARFAILKLPMVAVMEVHQSFFSYTGGVYQSLGPTDPHVGWHCVGCIGISDITQSWRARNSWGTGWGMDGYFVIGYGDSHFDDEFWTLVPDMSPVPVPPTPPQPLCPWFQKAKAAAKASRKLCFG